MSFTSSEVALLLIEEVVGLPFSGSIADPSIIESCALTGRGRACLPIMSPSEVARIVFALLSCSFYTMSKGLIPVSFSSESSAACSISGSGKLGVIS